MDVKTKITIFRVLKVISYCAGFPLMLLLVWKDAMYLFVSDIYIDTAYNGVCIALAVWAFVTLAQIGIAFLTKGCKNSQVKLVSVLAVALIATILPALIIDSVYGKKISKIADEQEETYGIEIESYNKMASWYLTRTEDRDSYALELSENVANFCRVYNIEYFGENLGENIDGAEITEDEVNYVYTKPNGMYADGYVFGLKQAMDILIDYNEVKESYGSYAAVEAAYAAALQRAYASPEWIAYSTTQEFIDNEAIAMQYYVGENKINVILGVLGSQLMDIEFMGGNLLNTVLPIVETIELDSGLTVAETLASVGVSLTATVGGKTVANPDFFNNLTIDTLIPLVNTLGIEITEEEIMDLLSGYSFYLSSYNKPIWDFFTDEDSELARYGLAKYYATQHGALCDSVLISEDEDGRIGQASDLDGMGYPVSYAYSLEDLYELRAELSYGVEMYPVISVRYYLYVFSGIISLGFVLASIFAARQKKLEEEI